MNVEAATLEVWKTTIEVQKHFNELSMRVRSIAVTVLAAFLAAAGYALKEKSAVGFLGQRVSLTGMILLGALICWLAFYVMDRLWYHRLLRAAVRHGRKVEEALKGSVATIDLTETIDDASPIWGMRAGHRLSIFYGFVVVLLWLAGGSALGASSPYYILGSVFLLVAAALESSTHGVGANRRRGFMRLGLAVGVLYFGWWGLTYWLASNALPKYLRWSGEASAKGDWKASTIWMQSANDAGATMNQSLLWGVAVPIVLLIIGGLIYWIHRGFKPGLKVVPTSNS